MGACFLYNLTDSIAHTVTDYGDENPLLYDVTASF